VAGRGGGSGDAALGIATIQARNETRGTVLADRVEIGSSLWAKFWGLMGRASLAPGSALWLPGDNGIHMFFMRFPIDAVFVGREGGGRGSSGRDGTARGGAGRSENADGSVSRSVVAVRRALRPWTGLVPFVRGADGVIELPVGTIDATGTQPGDVVRIV
jgi:uncharacterized membrane protein (UPF0127 family)